MNSPPARGSQEAEFTKPLTKKYALREIDGEENAVKGGGAQAAGLTVSKGAKWNFRIGR